MKYLGKITDPKDLVTKEYVDAKIGPSILYDRTITWTPSGSGEGEYRDIGFIGSRRH